jgi:hypothetical protein
VQGEEAPAQGQDKDGTHEEWPSPARPRSEICPRRGTLRGGGLAGRLAEEVKGLLGRGFEGAAVGADETLDEDSVGQILQLVALQRFQVASSDAGGARDVVQGHPFGLA